MTAKHTPGPWVAVGAWVERPYEDCPDICSCDPESIGQRGRTYDEQCANARLIAAAPDLLEACRAVINSKKPLSVGLSLCHKAIAKAEGRA